MDQKQRDIIKKSATLFLKHGIKSVTMDDLARELGVSKKTIYKYFNDKDDLITKIVVERTNADREVCETARVESKNAIDALFNISDFISNMLSEVHSSVFFDLQKYHKKAWNIMREHRGNFVKSQIRENIKRGQKEGLYLESLNSEVAASIYISTMNALFDANIFQLNSLTFSEIFNEIINFQIRGMASEKGYDYLKMKNKQ